MADSKITALTALTGANVATGDVLTLVDISDTTMDATGTNKKITADELRKAMGVLGETSTDAIWDAKGDLAVGTGADTASKLTVGADGTELVADSSQTTGLAWKSRSRCVTDVHTDTTAVNTTAEVVVASLAIPTTVAAGDVLRMMCQGDLLNNSASGVNYSVRVLLGATAVLSSTTISISGSLPTRRYWRVELDVLIVATNDQRLTGLFHISGSSTSLQLNNGVAGSTARGTATEDLTAGKNLQLAVTMGTASAAADFVCHETYLTVGKR